MKIKIELGEYIELEGDLDYVISSLQGYKEKYPEYELSLEKEYEPDNYIHFSLYGTREETIEETKNRIDKNNNEESRIRERELKLLKTLKEKYER